MKVSITIELEADSQEEAEEKLEAFAQINDSLEHDQLIGMGDYMENNPKAVTKLIGWIQNPPGWMKPFIKQVKED